MMASFSMIHEDMAEMAFQEDFIAADGSQVRSTNGLKSLNSLASESLSSSMTSSSTLNDLDSVALLVEGSVRTVQGAKKVGGKAHAPTEGCPLCCLQPFY